MTGQVAWDSESRIVGERDREIQLRQWFDNVEQIFKAVGGEREDIVSLTIFFLHHADLPVIQRVRAQRRAPGVTLAGVLIQTPGLVDPRLPVEPVPIAVIPNDRYHEPGGEWQKDGFRRRIGCRRTRSSMIAARGAGMVQGRVFPVRGMHAVACPAHNEY